MQTATTIYDKLGGETAIEKVVDEFYEKVLADDTVNGFFKNTDMEKQRRHQAAFIGYALGSGRQFTGKSMEKAHTGMNLQPKHYDAIIRHLSATLKEFHVEDGDIRQIEDKLNTLRSDILYK